MGFVDNLKENAIDLAQTGVAKSKQLAEIAKLKLSSISEEDAIKKAYLELGKLYFTEHGLSPEGAYAAACERIIAAKAAIEANNDRIAELKAEGGINEAESAPAEVVDAEVVADDVTADDIVDEVTEAAEEIKEAAQEAVEEVKEAVEEIKED